MAARFELKLISLIFFAASAVQNSTAQKPKENPLAEFGGVEIAAHTPAVGPPRKDIPTIAKGAKKAIVTIVTAVEDKPIALGTGFIVSADGVIVTNYHVIKTGNVAAVKFSDGTVLAVDGVLAADKVRDLAIIKVHGKNFRALALGNSDRVQIGEDVVAIGNPLGLELTVSNGILSGVRTDEKEGGKFLQVTAPISHGSSGGPLFNMAGEVIGITSMYLEGGENLNFAIPVNDAKNLLSTKSATVHSLPNEQPSENATSAEENEDSNELRKEFEQTRWLQMKTGHRDLNSDELKETLRWMRDTLPDGSSVCLRFSASTTCNKVELKISGCSVGLDILMSHMSGALLHQDPSFAYYFDLGNVDSERMFSKSEHDDSHEYEEFYLYTWNDTRTILYVDVPANQFKNQLSFRLTKDYSVRFEKAFRHAVELCGGRPSTVKF